MGSQPLNIFSGTFYEVFIFVWINHMVLLLNKGFISLLASQRITAQTVPFGIDGKQAFGMLRITRLQMDSFQEEQPSCLIPAP